MLVEATRMITDALAHPTYGVNAQLASMTLDGSDTVPPSIVTIIDDTRSILAAWGRVPQRPQDLPALVVSIQSDYDINGEVTFNYREGEIPFGIQYVTRDVESASGTASSYYTIWAVLECLEAFGKNINAADRQRGTTQIISATKLTHSKKQEQHDDGFVTFEVAITYRVRSFTEQDS